MQIRDVTHSLNQSNHYIIKYAQPPEGERSCIFPAISHNQSDVSAILSTILGKISNHIWQFSATVNN